MHLNAINYDMAVLYLVFQASLVLLKQAGNRRISSTTLKNAPATLNACRFIFMRIGMIAAAIRVRCVFVWYPPTFLATPVTLNLFHNPVL